MASLCRIPLSSASRTLKTQASPTGYLATSKGREFFLVRDAAFVMLSIGEADQCPERFIRGQHIFKLRFDFLAV